MKLVLRRVIRWRIGRMVALSKGSVRIQKVPPLVAESIVDCIALERTLCHMQMAD